MTNASQPFDFSQFVPGFDFLKNLAGGAAAGTGAASSVPGIPSLASWVAPTLSVEEVDKRIQELKTVQYWLEQNGHALKATIQALEVQKMTLSTLRGMNVRMEDLASVFTKQAAAAAAPAPAPFAAAAAPEPEPVEEEEEDEAEIEEEEAPAPKKKPRGKAAADGAGVVDPMQWWGSLTEQFQQIASTALQDAAQLKVPAMAQPLADAVGKVMGKTTAAAKKSAAKTAARTAAKKAATPAAKKKTSTASRKRTTGRR
ncbi:ribosomal protein L12E/L44/L45/RPP1/RPP2 [Variovorax boronicumulans]|uniref:PhaM family polyhydroxyalkanoate granule multifunctional regulatory protein n=1 Tax=Variovorax boronicumulans TaxID=436515 RepID=UPI002780B7A6|nr:PhaM family polyhydroxyalkanoate granule multifunctional regulatory protein [Variovorax boronicumulans]MDP9994312.1 ribosomal protein L12E/L44/L45/RPP1/RPP2 [Variovorax boronicumulans]MDQ0005413.1 ribosomal protein L12E/L44/L45/RPP1/RPP2 [Variovorax boronicumulans]